MPDLAIGEKCDDGNKDGGDGCSSDCLSTEVCGNLIDDDCDSATTDTCPNVGQPMADDEDTGGSGCNCATPGGGGAWLLGALAPVVARRRRTATG